MNPSRYNIYLFTWKCIFAFRWQESVSLTLASVRVWTTTNCRRCFEHNCTHCLYHRTYMAWSRNVTGMSQPNLNLVRKRDLSQLHLPMNSLPTFCSYWVDILAAQYFANGVRKRNRDSLHVPVTVLHRLRFLLFLVDRPNHLSLVDLVDHVRLSNQYLPQILRFQQCLQILSGLDGQHRQGNRCFPRRLEIKSGKVRYDAK